SVAAGFGVGAAVTGGVATLVEAVLGGGCVDSGAAAATTVSASTAVFSVAAGRAAAGGSPSFNVCVRIGTGSCATGNCKEAGPVSTGFSGPSSTQGISHTAIA